MNKATNNFFCEMCNKTFQAYSSEEEFWEDIKKWNPELLDEKEKISSICTECFDQI